MATAQIDINTRLKNQLTGRVTGLQFSHTDQAKTIFDIADRYAVNHRALKAGTGLFAEGEESDSLYIVLEGWLFLHRILEDGRRQILDFALPGDVIGFCGKEKSPLTFSADAITNAVIAVIPLRHVTELLRNDTASAMMLLRAGQEALLGAFDTLTDIGRRTAREAVAHFLLRIHRRSIESIGPDQDRTISFPLHQEHIGDALGLTAVHVCRTLRKLRNDGLVEISRGHLRLPNPDALAEEAGIYDFEDTDFRLAS